MIRRSEKAITNREDQWTIIQQAPVCRVAMCDGDQPYVLPLCFGICGDVLYLHCATAGRKLEVLRCNPRVCVEFDIDHAVIPAEEPCQIGFRYRSVLAFGKATIVSDEAERLRGLQAIVRHYADVTGDMPATSLTRTTVLRIEIDEMTGKQSGYPIKGYGESYAD